LDALEALDRARKAALDQHALDDYGRQQRSVGFRLHDVVLLAGARRS
jgi:hypothetical protein